MLNTSFQPMLSHLFNNPSVLEKLNHCKISTDHLTSAITAMVNAQFQNLHQQHEARLSENTLTIFEHNTDIEMPATYRISLFLYPEEIIGIEKSIKQNHDVLLFFTPQKNESHLSDYLDSLDHYGAPLKSHTVNIDTQPFIIQILERYYDFDTSTFNDFR